MKVNKIIEIGVKKNIWQVLAADDFSRPTGKVLSQIKPLWTVNPNKVDSVYPAGLHLSYNIQPDVHHVHYDWQFYL